MRTSWSARMVTFLVALLMFSACGDNNQITRVTVNLWLPLGTRTDTTGTCVRTTRIGTSDTSNVAGMNIILPQSESDSLMVSQSFNPANCGTPYTYRWSTSNAGIVSVTAYDLVSARITAVSPGTAVITATAIENSSVVLSVTVIVPGVTPTTVTITPSVITRSSGLSCTRTEQMTATTANPSGLSGVWSVSGIGGASVSSSGLVSWAANSSGTLTVTFTASNGATGSTTIVVNSNSCATAPTAVSISVEPATATLYAGQTMTLGTGLYRVVVTMSDGTTRINDPNTFSCSSANTSQVTVNSSACLISAIVPTTSGGVVVTYTALGVTGVTDTLVVSVNAVPVISLSPVSLCFSTVVGTPQSHTVTVTVTGANVSDVVLTSNTTGVTVSGSGSTWTVTRTAGSALANGSLVATLTTMSGVVTAIPVQIISSVCPGTNSSIDFTPSGGPLPVGLDTLTATCVQGAEIPNVCEPYWTSSDPSIATVRGITAKSVGPMTYWVGVTAYLERLRPGTVEICVQWSLTQTSPRRCYTFVNP